MASVTISLDAAVSKAQTQTIGLECDVIAPKTIALEANVWATTTQTIGLDTGVGKTQTQTIALAASITLLGRMTQTIGLEGDVIAPRTIALEANVIGPISSTVSLEASVAQIVAPTIPLSAHVQGSVLSPPTIVLDAYVVIPRTTTTTLVARVKATTSQTIGLEAIVQGFFTPVQSSGTPYGNCLVRMYRDLADEHVWNKDFRNTTDFRTYDFLRMFCRQLTVINTIAEEIRTNAVAETCENVRLYDNFGVYFAQEKQFEQPSDIHDGTLQGYRRQNMFYWYAGTLGSSQAAVRWIDYGVLGISPRIQRVRDLGWILADTNKSILGETTIAYEENRALFGSRLTHFVPASLVGTPLEDTKTRVENGTQAVVAAGERLEHAYTPTFTLYATTTQLQTGTYSTAEFEATDARVRVQQAQESAGGTFTYTSEEIVLASIVTPIIEYDWFIDWCTMEADDHLVAVSWAGRDSITLTYSDWVSITDKEQVLTFVARGGADYDIGAYEYIFDVSNIDRIKIKFDFTILQEGNVRYATLYSYGVKAVGSKITYSPAIALEAYVST